MRKTLQPYTSTYQSPLKPSHPTVCRCSGLHGRLCDMGLDQPDGYAGNSSSDSSLTRGQRLILYFNSTRRKTVAVLAAVAGWFAVIFFATRAGEGWFFSNLPNVYLYVAVPVLWFLFTQGAMRRRPVRLPADVMRKTAAQRFSNEESWESTMTRQEALDTLLAKFNGVGVSARAVESTVWVEMGKEWSAADWRRKEAAEHIKAPPSAHFFIDGLVW